MATLEYPPTAVVHGVASVLQQRFHGRHVLVVEDDREDLGVAARLLESAALAVDTAESAPSAIAKACAYTYAAVLMRVRMSSAEGLEATRRLRTVPGYQHVPIIALTDAVVAEEKVRGYEAGLNDIVVRPFSPDTLFDTLLRWLSQRHDDFPTRLAALTERERQVMQYVVAGLSNKAIARELKISHKTVETHRSHMMRKLGATSLADLQQQAQRHVPAD